MTRSAQQRYDDMLAAIDRCLTYKPYLDDAPLRGMAYDAILRNLAVIGEAVRDLPEQDRADFPDVPWSSIAGLRNVVIHEYFRVRPDLILDIVEHQLAPLAEQLRSR